MRSRLSELDTELQQIDKAAGDAALTSTQQTRWDELITERESLRTSYDEALEQEIRLARVTASRAQHGGFKVGSSRTDDRTDDPSVWRRESDGDIAVIGSEQRAADHPVVKRMVAAQAGSEAATVGQYGDLDALVRAITTSGASAIVPTTWAAGLIDLARNHAAVLQAGASVIPMDAKTVEIGRLTGDPTAAFRTEGSAITPSDPTFDNVVLTAHSLSALVVGSREWFQDSQDGRGVVSQAIAKAMGQAIDLAALYGGITAGSGSINLASPPNPVGVLKNTLTNASANVLGAATNGTTQTAVGSGNFYGELLDLVYAVKNANESPSGIIWPSKLQQVYAKAVDTTGQPLQMPADVSALSRFTSNQVASGFTQGTLTTAADVFVGDWSQLLVGTRLDLTLQVLTERYADNGQIGVVATWRGDFAVARNKAFAVYRALKGA